MLATISILQYELNLISHYILTVGSSGALWLNTICMYTCTQQGIYVFSAQNNHWELVSHLFKIGTLLQTINGFPIGNVQ